MATYQVDPWVALSDPTRRAIFERVLTRPGPVGELARGMEVSRPAVSQHLKVLRNAGLVVVRPAGTRRIYAVDREGLAELRDQLDRYWSDALAAYKNVVEQEQEEKDR